MASTNRRNAFRHDLAAAALIYGATLLAYFPALRGGFIWDDDFHVTKPGLRSLHGLWLIWTGLGDTAQYYPLLHSAFWLEHRLWGDAVIGYHLVNVLLHATSACLFGLILRRLIDSRAALFGALLFALHPVCVESVAWIAEQKNTLSTVFYLLAALAYLQKDEGGELKPELRSRKGGSAGPSDATGVDPSHGPNGGAGTRPPTSVGSEIHSGLRSHPSSFRYASALSLFVAALLSKSVTATLPAALLVVLWWKRGSLSWKRDVLPLVPWLALGVSSGLFTAWIERVNIGAQGADFSLTAIQRCLVAGRVIWFYLGKLLWPADLIFVYRRWNVDSGVWWQYLFPLGVLVALAALACISRRTRGPLAAFLVFCGSLFPVLGFVNVFPFKYSFVADHYQYLGTLGIFALVASAKSEIEKRREDAFRFPQMIATALICVLGVLTFRECGEYIDAETLYRTTIERNPDCWFAYNNLGNLMLDRGRSAEAMADYEKVLQYKPEDPIPHNNLGLALAGTGRLPEAVAQYDEALRLLPGYAEAHRNRAVALRRMNRLEESMADCEEALRLEPLYPEARADLARALAAEGRYAEAIDDFQAALRLQPGSPETHADYGTALAQAGRLADAIAEYEEALRLNPNYAAVDNNLGVALAQANRLPEALARFEEAIRLKPDYRDARENRNLILQAMGQPTPK